jgi:hypothetical protein
MNKEEFNNLVIHGFDVEFNYKNVFYSITIGEKDGDSYFFLANEYKWYVKFKTIQELNEYVLIDKTIIQIISELPEEEIFY